MTEETLEKKPTNGLGIAGFVISLVGLCSGGLLSPVGLIVSLVALKNQPRGLAIAGVVIGALGSCGVILSLLLIPFVVIGVLVAAGATAAAVTIAAVIGGPQLEAQVEMGIIAGMVEQYNDKQGHMPATLDDALSALKPDSGLRTDSWDHPYILEYDADGSYKLRSMGADGQDGTDDDIVYNGAFSFGFDAPSSPPTQTPQPPTQNPAGTTDTTPQDTPTPPPPADTSAPQ